MKKRRFTNLVFFCHKINLCSAIKNIDFLKESSSFIIIALINRRKVIEDDKALKVISDICN